MKILELRAGEGIMAQLTGFYLIHGSHIFTICVGRRWWGAMRVESDSICFFDQLYSQNAQGECPGEFWAWWI